jgi:hypothetical protein
MFYVDFPSIPFILVIILQDWKILFCIFLRFRDLRGLKLTQDFWSINILPREATGGEEVNETRPRAKRDQVERDPGLATPPRLV